MTCPSLRSRNFPTWQLGVLLSAVSLLASCSFDGQGQAELPTAAIAPQAVSPKPEASVTQVPEFRSTLESFKPYTETEMVPWKAANDRVGEIGGWRVYAREPFETPEPVETAVENPVENPVENVQQPGESE